MATRIPANQEAIVAKLLQRLTSHQMDQQPHTVPRPLTNTAHLHTTLPKVSMAHPLTQRHQDNMAPLRIVKLDIKTPRTEAVDPHPTMDIAQLHTNILRNKINTHLLRLRRHTGPINNNTPHLLLHTPSSTLPLHRQPYRISTLARLHTQVMGLLRSMANTEAKQDTILGTGDRIFTGPLAGR
ncbi:hypothetical protein ANO14919_115500 [Xylariales sp. No.14919]|nr:hypothetical protein ANO14919_115500 [Xylariales sp. No.14919]